MYVRKIRAFTKRTSEMGLKFEKGNPGKPKGAVNKSTRVVKEVFADVFSRLQQSKKANLQNWAEENPTEFYKLASKLIPVQLTGDADNPVAVNITEGMTFEQLYQLKYGSKPNEIGFARVDTSKNSFKE